MTVVAVTVLSDGQALGLEAMVKSIDVTLSVDRVPDATIVFLDGQTAQPEFPLLDADHFKPDRVVGIQLRFGSEADVTVFEGLPVRTSLRVVGGSPELVVELRGRAIKMTRVRKSRVLADTTDADAFRALIEDNGLTAGTVADTGVTHQEMVQYRVTDWDFLVTRAQAFGFCVVPSATGATIDVKSPEVADRADLTFALGVDNVLDLELEEDGLSQVNGTQTTGWDVAEQAALEPSEGEDVTTSHGTVPPNDAAQALSTDPEDLSNMTPSLAEEMSGWATGRLRRVRYGYLRGRVAMLGKGELAPLQTIELTGVGERFSGKALVGTVRHRVDATGWITEAELGMSAAPLIAAPGIQEEPAGGLLPGAPGVQVGVVEAFEEDPDGEQRLRLKIPALGPDAQPVWARLAVPYGGEEYGILFRPEVGDEVIVAFVNGDPRRPVVLGSVLSGARPPPEGIGDPTDANEAKGIVTRSGTKILFSDADNPAVTIETPSGNKVTLDDDDQSLKLTDQHGNTVEMTSSGIALKSASDVLIEASGNVNITGSAIEMS